MGLRIKPLHCPDQSTSRKKRRNKLNTLEKVFRQNPLTIYHNLDLKSAWSVHQETASAEVWYIQMSPTTLINIFGCWLRWETLLGAWWWWWWSLVRSWCDRGVPWAHMTTSYPLTSDHWLWAHLTLLTISSYGHPRHSQLYHSQLQLEKAFQWQAHIAHSMAYHLWMCNVNGILDYKSDLWLYSDISALYMT